MIILKSFDFIMCELQNLTREELKYRVFSMSYVLYNLHCCVQY